MRIVFASSALFGGGAERVLVNMANYWARRGHSVEVLTLCSKDNVPFYKLDETVVYKPLGLSGDSNTSTEFIFNNLRRTRAVRDVLRQARPDVVISFMDRMNVLVLLASMGLRIPVVVCEHNDPAHCRIGGPNWEILRSVAYSYADSVVMLTEKARSYFGPRIRRRAVVIPNAINFPGGSNGAAPAPQCGHKAISVGRLGHQKGYDLLLEAFARVHLRFPQWSLTIWGEGRERSRLERLRTRLGLDACVRLPGMTHDPFKEMRDADLFVSSSRYEGFPMVVLEAMACELPVVAFDCPSGTREIVRHEVDGLLVPPQDPQALANAMGRLMQDSALRTQFGRRAGEVLERFSEAKIMSQWEKLLGSLVKAPVRHTPKPRAAGPAANVVG